MLNIISFLLPLTLSVNSSSRSGIEFVYTPNEPSFRTDGVYIEGTSSTGSEGEPSLPIKLINIGIPPGATVRVSIVGVEKKEFAKVEVPPVPVVREFGYEWIKDDRVYSKDSYFPEKIIEISEKGWLRDQNFVRLKIWPVKYNPVKKILVFYSRILVRVSFNNGERGNLIPDPYFEGIGQSLFINYNEAKYWRKRPAKRVMKKDKNIWVKMKIRDEGIYIITYNDIRNLGIDPEYIDPTSFRVFTSGCGMEIHYEDTLKEVPTWVKDDTIFFYAASLNGYEKNLNKTYYNIYTDTNVYWLSFGGIQGRRDSLSGNLGCGAPHIPADFYNTLHLEKDNNCPALSGRMWIWERMERDTMSESSEKNFPFSVYGIGDSRAEIKISLYSYFTNREGIDYVQMHHHLRFYLNGIRFGEEEWTGNVSINAGDLKIFVDSVSNLREGENNLTIELYKGNSSTNDIIFPDWFEITYRKLYKARNGELKFCTSTPDTTEFHISGFLALPIIFDITDPLNPVRIYGIRRENDTVSFQTVGNHSFYAATGFKKPISIEIKNRFSLQQEDTVDYIIITPSEFLSYANMLKNYRKSRSNLRIKAVRLNEIYDNFSFGIKNPWAIRNFLINAYRNWETPPSYCLLFGAGTFAYKVGSRRDRVPPWEDGYSVGDYGYSPSSNPCYDNWFGMICGKDKTPDIIIGRITAESRDEARIVVRKIRDYERNQGPWRNWVLFVADDEYGVGNSETMHTKAVENMAALTPQNFDKKKLYLINYPRGSRGLRGKNDLIKYVTDGAVYGCFMGHGNIYKLTHEDIFTSPADIYALHNESKLPFFYFGSCDVGCFDRPDRKSTADHLQIIEGRGAIATLAATRSSEAGSNASLGYKLINSLLSDTTTKTIGEGVFKAQTPGTRTNYTLFGDPTTEFSRYTKNMSLEVKPESLIGGKETTLRGWTGNFSDGYAYITAFSSMPHITYHWACGGTISYLMPGDVCFEGLTTIVNDSFVYNFFIPTRLDSGNSGRVSVYMWDENMGGGIVRDSLVTGIDEPNTLDKDGPSFRLFIDGKSVSDKMRVLKKFSISGNIEDKSGINLKRGIYLRINGIEDHNLTKDFRYDLGSGTRGSFSSSIELSSYNVVDTLLFSVFDNVDNNSNREFTVERIYGKDFIITDLMNFPNPVRGDKTRISFYSSRPGWGRLKIYTISGRRIITINVPNITMGTNTILWDTRDEMEDDIANGVYIYKLEANSLGESSEGKASAIGKLIILR